MISISYGWLVTLLFDSCNCFSKGVIFDSYLVLLKSARAMATRILIKFPDRRVSSLRRYRSRYFSSASTRSPISSFLPSINCNNRWPISTATLRPFLSWPKTWTSFWNFAARKRGSALSGPSMLVSWKARKIYTPNIFQISCIVLRWAENRLWLVAF